MIFSATLRSGSLSLVGSGASDALLMPPAPIRECMASTAGFGVVSRILWLSCCLFLLASAKAAAPVKGNGDLAGEKRLRSKDFGESSTEVNAGSCTECAGGASATSLMVGKLFGTVGDVAVGVSGVTSTAGKFSGSGGMDVAMDDKCRYCRT